MRQIHKENEIEQGQTRSLLLIASAFALANIFLIFGFGQSAQAAPMESTMALATMLASPQASISLSWSQLPMMGAVVSGLAVMTISSIAFSKTLVRDLSS